IKFPGFSYGPRSGHTPIRQSGDLSWKFPKSQDLIDAAAIPKKFILDLGLLSARISRKKSRPGRIFRQGGFFTTH
ncbi:MAG: hypothetical protein R6W69_00930, partial [Anaerolineales bacterium]